MKNSKILVIWAFFNFFSILKERPKYGELYIEMHNLMVPLDLSFYVITFFYQFHLILKISRCDRINTISKVSNLLIRMSIQFNREFSRLLIC